MRRGGACLGAALALGLAGCGGPRGVVTFAPEAGAVGEASAILVATSRAPTATADLFSRDRAADLSFARFVVSVPPERSPGVIAWPDGAAPDPSRHFLTVSRETLPGPGAFAAAIDAGLNADRWNEAIIYVHGYNTTFAEGLYRHVQMDVDFNMPDVAISYGWSSAGSLRGYVYDKESAIYAAEGLAELIDLVARSDVAQITLVGHSMGALVAMEALRLLDLRDAAALRQLHAVALLAPDLDLDIFRQRMDAVAARRIPVYVFVSGGDRALEVSALLQGGRPRLGAVTDAAALSDLPVHLIDVTNVGAADPLDHDTVAQSPVMISLVRGLGETGAETFADLARGDAGPIETGLHAIEHATRVAVDPMHPR